MPNKLIGQRFQTNDRVSRRNYSAIANTYQKKYGNISEAIERKNSAGSKMYYYKVLWEDNRSSEHAQHSLDSVK